MPSRSCPNFEIFSSGRRSSCSSQWPCTALNSSWTPSFEKPTVMNALKVERKQLKVDCSLSLQAIQNFSQLWWVEHPLLQTNWRSWWTSCLMTNSTKCKWLRMFHLSHKTDGWNHSAKLLKSDFSRSSLVWIWTSLMMRPPRKKLSQSYTLIRRLVKF